MAFTFMFLLCLGLSTRSRIPVLTGALPKPTIKAEPGTLVYKGMQVFISCKGISDAWKYLLYIQKFEYTQPLHTQTSTNHGEKAVFHISSVGKHDGGQYSCCYETTAGWSVHSDKLELVVTGFFDNKPILSALPRPMVTSGESVTLKCFSQKEYDKFIVIKEGKQKHSMIMKSQKTYVGQFQALFSVGPVTPNSSGTFKCYGYYKASPQIWSEPSDHLDIYVSGSPGTIGLFQNMSKAKTASETKDHTVENLIRMGMAGLVIIILGILLFEACHNHTQDYHAPGELKIQK
ncbi:leukocyte immunoglobulin-like receptor subfamily A member 5 [Grammomys surdaster]|uniref:leukocyte immunoglobulin-like receptor subfamily A member 5 n=1 Tax=Grammomys surdaster TaxID=491861 RepID=UPI00109FDEB3|nr:leukocyte immunoglobulin-like receptor subfamily A member 5 [Grammomys surdaster]